MNQNTTENSGGYYSGYMGAAYGGLEGQEEPDLGSLLSYVLDVLRRKWHWIASIALATLAIATTVAFLMTPKYDAAVKIKLDPRRSAAVDVTATDGMADQNLVDTEVKAILSRDVALDVVNTLKLANGSEFSPKPEEIEKAKDEGLTAVDLTANKVREAVSANREGLTYVITIKARSKSPEVAARIANQYVTSYMNFGVGMRSGTASRQAEMIKKRLAEVGQELAGIEGEAAQAKAQAGIMGGGANGSYGSTVIDQQIASLSSQLATARSTAAAAQSKLAVAQQQMRNGGMEAVSAVLNSQVVADLRRQRAEVVRDMGEIQSRYGPRHPETIKVTQQLQQLDDQIDAEARRVVGGLTSEAAAESAKAASIQAQMDELKGQQASTTRAGVAAQGVQLKADAKRTLYNQLAAELQKAESLSRNNMTQAQVVDAATPPLTPAFPNKMLFMAFGLFLGLFLGVGTVTVQEILVKGVKNPDDIERLFGTRVLTSVPEISKKELMVDGRPISPADMLLIKPLTAYSEAFRVIKTVLGKVESRVAGAPVVTMASSVPNEGKTTSALALARVLAMGGERILLVDADIRKAGLSKLVEGTKQEGLIEVLNGTANVQDVIVKDKADNLDVLPVAKSTFDTADYFSGEGFGALLDSLRGSYDKILVDTPPILAVSDARAIISRTDATIMVVRWGDTPARVLRAAFSWLQQDEAHLVGVMMNSVDLASGALSGMYYSKAYKDYYQEA